MPFFEVECVPVQAPYTLFESGFTTVGEAAEAAQRVQESIYERMREGRELA